MLGSCSTEKNRIVLKKTISSINYYHVFPDSATVIVFGVFKSTFSDINLLVWSIDDEPHSFSQLRLDVNQLPGEKAIFSHD